MTLLVAVSGATLFFLELHVGHALAPALGGGALVWLSTLLLFQVILLAGYATAGLLLPVAAQRRVSGGLLLAGAAFGTTGFVHGIGVGTLLTALGLTTILPLALRAGADTPETTRARWIAASNLGALVGLALYAALEPVLGLANGANVLRLLSLGLGLAALRVGGVDRERGGYRPRVAAVASAFVGVFWYMSLHARIEATSPPSVQLWALTLGLYLLSFGIPFLGRRQPSALRWVAVVVAAAAAATEEFVSPGFRAAAGLIALFIGALSAHFALREDFDDQRPWAHGAVDAGFGGALGGALALVVTPLVLTTHEQILWAVLLLGTLEIARARPARDTRLAAGLTVLVGVGLAFTQPLQGRDTVRTVRSWYGEFRVLEHQKDDPRLHHLALQHQFIVHGAQYLHEDFDDLPTAYYSIFSGAGMAIDALQDVRGAAASRRMAVVGLGTGALAAYADRTDTIHFFEIDRRNAALSAGDDPLFHFLEICRGNVDVTYGDGRRELEKENAAGAPRYDILVLDAFSGGNVPSHLLTLEAFEAYAERVRRDGWIVAHTSNTSLDLRPVLYAAAEHVGARAWFVRNRGRSNPDGSTENAHLVMLSDWIVIGWDASPWEALEARLRPALENEDVRSVQDSRQVVFDDLDAWTDDHRSVWSVRQGLVAARERRAEAADRSANGRP